MSFALTELCFNKICVDNAYRLTRSSSINLFRIGTCSGQKLEGVRKGALMMENYIKPFLHSRYTNVQCTNLTQSKTDCPVTLPTIFTRIMNTDPADFEIFLGGDHAISVASIGSFLQKNQYYNPGVIWVDAHTDINTKHTSVTKNLHGMPVAYLLGLTSEDWTELEFTYKLRPENIVYIGARDIDDPEQEIIKHLGIKIYDMNYIKTFGMINTITSALSYLEKCGKLHMSFDVDAMDCVTGTGTFVDNGITYYEALDLVNVIAESPKFVSADFVEFNPDLTMYSKNELQLIGDIILSSCTTFKSGK
jgi:arginase